MVVTNEQQRQVWNHPDIKDEWPDVETITDVATPILLSALELESGQRVLDVGCGGGRTTMQLGRVVGESGRVTGIDFRPRS